MVRLCQVMVALTLVQGLSHPVGCLQAVVAWSCMKTRCCHTVEVSCRLALTFVPHHLEEVQHLLAFALAKDLCHRVGHCLLEDVMLNLATVPHQAKALQEDLWLELLEQHPAEALLEGLWLEHPGQCQAAALQEGLWMEPQELCQATVLQVGLWLEPLELYQAKALQEGPLRACHCLGKASLLAAVLPLAALRSSAGIFQTAAPQPIVASPAKRWNHQRP